MKDLVRDNPGLLAGLWNLDKGCWVVPLWWDTPDTDNDEIQSSIEARKSSIYAGNLNRIQERAVLKNGDIF